MQIKQSTGKFLNTRAFQNTREDNLQNGSFSTFEKVLSKRPKEEALTFQTL
jgi:hypothetical protein